jgi:hypothetical protein
VDVVVVLKLCEGKEVGPIILLLIKEEPEILLEFLVHSFSLPIPLRVVGRGESWLALLLTIPRPLLTGHCAQY